MNPAATMHGASPQSRSDETPFGPRFWPSDHGKDGEVGPDDHTTIPSNRWTGLRRAWRMAWHLRACLAALVIVCLGLDALVRHAGPGSVAIVVAMVPLLAFAILAVNLTVAFMLGILQAITGWPLHELESWFQGLRWWQQVGVLPVLVGFVCLPTVALIIGSILLTVKYLGLVK